MKKKYYALYLGTMPDNPCYYESIKELAECLEDMWADEEEIKATIKVVKKSKKWVESLGDWEP